MELHFFARLLLTVNEFRETGVRDSLTMVACLQAKLNYLRGDSKLLSNSASIKEILLISSQKCATRSFWQHGY
jgi:hypothetical protein